MAEQENGYKELLTLYNKLQSDNQKQKDAGVHDYSLMNALLKKTDEVNLHSNFIYSMINPTSTHYCGTDFLELFLDVIDAKDFITLNNAKVHKEVGKIDLLIEDGENVIIIENKLRAVDQPSQINRYILYTIENYLDGNKKLLSDNVHIVYLSEYKSEPSIKSKSIEGFTLGNDFLTWSGTQIDIQESNTKNTVKFDLDIGTKIKFTRVKHSKELALWAERSKEHLVNKPNSEGLIYAFNEYDLILKRLDTKQWRKIMSLDEYIKGLDSKTEQEIYAFMSESNKVFNDYLGKKLYIAISELFPERKACFINNKQFTEFNEKRCIDWFNKNGTKERYRDIGFESVKNGEKFIFALGVAGISYGSYKDNYKWNVKTTRENLQINKHPNLFSLIEDLKK